jgi:hypothetical protein
MATIDVMQMLRDAETAAVRELSAIRVAIKAMGGGLTSGVTGRSRRGRAAGSNVANGTGRRRRGMSAAARKAVSERMKRYWAERRRAKKRA